MIDALGGAGALRQKASTYLSGACLVQCLIDDDQAGRAAVDKAIGDRVLDLIDVNLCVVPQLSESELEDLYDKALYGEAFLKEFGVDPRKRRKSGRKRKWSDVMGGLFRESGKPWTAEVKQRTKWWLADFAASHGHDIVRSELSSPVDSFVEMAERKFPEE